MEFIFLLSRILTNENRYNFIILQHMSVLNLLVLMNIFGYLGSWPKAKHRPFHWKWRWAQICTATFTITSTFTGVQIMPRAHFCTALVACEDYQLTGHSLTGLRFLNKLFLCFTWQILLLIFQVQLLIFSGKKVHLKPRSKSQLI